MDIDANTLSYLKLADSDVRLGEEVLIIGNPLRYKEVVNKGKIIKKVNYKDWDREVLVLKGPIHKGSSGSPVLNKQEKL
ncbi:MAG: trypsin-like peptidase domain-containing protein [Firmicutes bacterium]|nr:trypsin-like peptidase domain-containing protein [Bacillota bacterium]